MKKSKIILSVVLALVLVCTALVAVACHKHEFGGEWYADATSHWQKATCEHTEEIGNKAPHNFQNGRCTVCGYTQDLSALLPYEKDTTLRIAAGYQKLYEGISFKDAGYVGSALTLPDGKTYHLNDLKPTWQQISADMGIQFKDEYTGNKAEVEFKNWNTAGLDKVDIVAGTAQQLQEAGSKGDLIDISKYLDKMPNFRTYLEENAIVRLSITGSVTGDNKGAIYFSPYFDGVDDIERYPLVRADLVRKLLDTDDVTGLQNRDIQAVKYQPFMPTTGKVEVDSLTADGKGTQKITKNYDSTKNIIEQMNSASDKKGQSMLKLFRKYIDDMYDYEKRSDLFLGYDAAWDADELVALLRCAVATLNNSDGQPVYGYFPRDPNFQREVDVYRFAGSLFGVRGMESRQDYLYFDKSGNLHDARAEESTYKVLDRLNQMMAEGLVTLTGHGGSGTVLEKDAGIVSYDYNQTQTIMNNTKLNEGEEYTPMMVPVSRWDDGTGEQFFRFTESWRSVKTEGWAISKAGVGSDTNKLNAALALIDFAFSVQGQITMSYGPDSFIQVKDANEVVHVWSDVEKKYVTEDFNGRQMPKIKDEVYQDMQTRKAGPEQKTVGGNYTNYARWFLGSTLNGFPKSQAFEYQCTHPIGKAGAAKVSAAIANGLIKHPLLAVNTDNMWYTSVPTTLPTTSTENNEITNMAELGGTNFSTDSGNKNRNIFLLLVEGAYTSVFGSTVTNATQAANYVKTQWKSAQYLTIKQGAWNKLKNYYEGK